MDSSYIKSNWKSWLFGLVFLATVAIAIAGLVIAVQAKSQPQQSSIYNIKNRNGKSPGGGTKPKLGGVLAAVGDTPPAYPYSVSADGQTTTFSGPVVFASTVTAQSLTTKVQNTTGNLACTTLVVGTGASIGNGIAASASPGLQVGNVSNSNATFSVFGPSTFDGTSSFKGVANFDSLATFAIGANFGMDSSKKHPSSFDSSGVLKVRTITTPTDSSYRYLNINQNLRVVGNAAINTGFYAGPLDKVGKTETNQFNVFCGVDSAEFYIDNDGYGFAESGSGADTDKNFWCSSKPILYTFWDTAANTSAQTQGMLPNPWAQGFTAVASDCPTK